ncbi:MAG: DMT family transporter [Pseudomonadota bacterium]
MSSVEAAPPTANVRSWFGPVLVLLGGIGVGFAPIGLRLSEMGPQTTAMWRYTFALPMVFLAILVVERRLPRRPDRFAVWAGLFFAVDIGLWHWGLTLTTVANATFIVNLGNAGVGLAAWLLFKERPAKLWFAAAAAALMGAALLSQGGSADGRARIEGDLLALAAAVMVVGYMICAKRARDGVGGLDLLFWMTLVEIPVAASMGLLAGEDFVPPSLQALWPLLFLAFAAHLCGQGFIMAGLGRTSAAAAGLLILVQPLTAAAISWRLFDEPLTGVQMFGAFLILLAIYAAQATGRSKPS